MKTEKSSEQCEEVFPNDRMNFLIVMVEQFSAYADPNHSDCQAETPALDSLAESGVRFGEAYCNAPVCGPSRKSFLTGR